MHAVENIDTGLSVLGGRYEYEVLTFWVDGVAHQHALVAGHRNRPGKFGYGYDDAAVVYIGDFHPVTLEVAACEGLTAHEVVGGEGVLLLEGDYIVAVDTLHLLYLAVGRRHAYLAADAADLLDEHLEHGHYLAHGEFVDGKVRQPILEPYTPPFAGESVNEFRGA